MIDLEECQEPSCLTGAGTHYLHTNMEECTAAGHKNTRPQGDQEQQEIQDTLINNINRLDGNEEHMS